MTDKRKHPFLTNAEFDAVGEYVRYVGNEIELRDWMFILAYSPPDDENCGASVLCINGRKQATVFIGREFLNLPPEEQRSTIVHELVHCHWETCWKMVQSDLAEALGKPTYYVFCDSYRRGMEYGVDALADSIAKHLPLIKWPTEKKRGKKKSQRKR